MITVDGLSKSYGSFKAVENISFTVNDGEITGLLGPNGAGKTTTLRMLSCYLRPDSGRIVVNGVDASEEPLKIKEMIGYLPESAPLYGEMLVYDYLMYVAEIRGIPAVERVREVAGICRIKDVMHRNINELSKGFRQRVGLAHAMIHDPGILILDEPTSGLDPIEIVEIRNLIRELGRSKTVILSTHILSEVEAACDRVIIINRGHIVADDSTAMLRGASGGGMQLALKVSGTGFEALKNALLDINGVSSVETGGEGELVSAKISLVAGADARPEIFRAAVSNGWILYEMKQEEESLENIFRELTAEYENGKA